jgi:hypothetical protein
MRPHSRGKYRLFITIIVVVIILTMLASILVPALISFF